jgi:type II secretory pathway component PulJ
MKKLQLGISLIEVLIVVSVFAILGTVVSTSLITTLRSAKKSESQVSVRENLNYTVSVIERNLRGAESIIDCGTNTDLTRIDYISAERKITTFSCQSLGEGGYIASDSARLTSDAVSITDCAITCNQNDLNSPPVVRMDLTAESASANNAEGSQVSITSEITIRNY